MRKTPGICALVLLASQAAYPHSYLPEPAAGAVTPIEDIGVSRAAYRTLSAPGQTDVYEFRAREGQEIYVQMTIPLLERQREFRPAFLLAFLGGGPAEFRDPNLEKGRILEPPPEVFGRAAPHPEGAEPPVLGVAYDGSEPRVFDEVFTGTRYWIRQTLTVAAPAEGTYRIAVWSPDGSAGKYVLATGRREAFGPGEIFGLPAVRWQVREFCEEPLWPDAVLWGLLAAAAAAGLVLGVLALVSP